MDRLEQIKNTVTANGMREWTDERVNQVAREYATEVARHNLERAAEIAHVELTVPKDTDLSKLEIEGLNISVEEVKNFKVRVNRESITSLEIELI